MWGLDEIYTPAGQAGASAIHHLISVTHRIFQFTGGDPYVCQYYCGWRIKLCQNQSCMNVHAEIFHCRCVPFANWQSTLNFEVSCRRHENGCDLGSKFSEMCDLSSRWKEDKTPTRARIVPDSYRAGARTLDTCLHDERTVRYVATASRSTPARNARSFSQLMDFFL